MQAISRDKHDKFCKLVQAIQNSQPSSENSLMEMKAQLEAIYKTYHHSLNDLKALIMEYDAKQKNIRQKMRQLLRNEISALENKNQDNLAE